MDRSTHLFSLHAASRDLIEAIKIANARQESDRARGCRGSRGWRSQRPALRRFEALLTRNGFDEAQIAQAIRDCRDLAELEALCPEASCEE